MTQRKTFSCFFAKHIIKKRSKEKVFLPKTSNKRTNTQKPYHMKTFNVSLICFALIFGFLTGFSTDASAKRKKSSKKKNDTTLVVPKPKENKDSVEYRKLIKDAVSQGRTSDNALHPTEKTLLGNSRLGIRAHLYVVEPHCCHQQYGGLSSPDRWQPNLYLLQLSRDSINVYLHKVQNTKQRRRKRSEGIAAAFDKNFLNPVLKAFKIEARNKGNVVIDVTSFFGGNEKCISPIKPTNPLSKLMGGGNSIKRLFVERFINHRSKGIPPEY